MMLGWIAKSARSVVRALSGSEADRASMWDGFRQTQEHVHRLQQELAALRQDLDSGRILAGQTLAAANAMKDPRSLRDVEFKVFSQFGDDGIIQYLIQKLDVKATRFIEFGVGEYRECNTRFLLANNNWRGLILEGNQDDVLKIQKDRLYAFHDLTAVNAFVRRDNINELFTRNGFSGSIGLLSIDIDGNDYWIWEAITAVDPDIVICEYNGVFGSRRAVTVPYDDGFVRQKAHASCLFYGASLRALALLAHRKGYAFVGANSGGNNAYFVKRTRLGSLRELSIEEGWVEPMFRESRDAEGKCTFLPGRAGRKLIANCRVYDVEREALVALGETD